MVIVLTALALTLAERTSFRTVVFACGAGTPCALAVRTVLDRLAFPADKADGDEARR